VGGGGGTGGNRGKGVIPVGPGSGSSFKPDFGGKQVKGKGRHLERTILEELDTAGKHSFTAWKNRGRFVKEGKVRVGGTRSNRLGTHR